MSSDGFWGTVSLHVENLVPGLATGGVVLAAQPALSVELAGGGPLGAACFVSSCYIAGAFTNVFARLVLDNLSHEFVRWWMLRGLAREKPRVKRLAVKDREGINREYSDTLTAGLVCAQPRIADEVAHRRGTGRILRSGWPPALVAAWLLHPRLPLGLDSISLWFVLPALSVVWLLVYAFAEVTIYREAYRAHSRRTRSASGSTLNKLQPESPSE